MRNTSWDEAEDCTRSGEDHLLQHNHEIKNFTFICCFNSIEGFIYSMGKTNCYSKYA